ncbi:MAG TPA: potassium channel family protein [Solirubrobacterales bacterium]|nr:potassium channel family protein [Solirubrobacterales bacterium]
MDARSEAIQQRFEWPVVIAATLTIPLLLIQESNLGDPWPGVATVLNWITWLVFATEVVVMLSVVPRKRTWLRTHMLDVAVTVLTPPFAPAAWQASRIYRLVRLLRLLRILSLRKLLSFDGIKFAAMTALGTVLLGGAVVASVEDQNWTTWDGIWWAATTVTTVGYGGYEPHTDSGRIIATAIMLIGIGFVALFTAFIADRFIVTQEATGTKQDQILAELKEIREKLERLEGR